MNQLFRRGNKLVKAGMMIHAAKVNAHAAIGQKVRSKW
jgi:hypothetical protein